MSASADVDWLGGSSLVLPGGLQPSPCRASPRVITRWGSAGLRGGRRGLQRYRLASVQQRARDWTAYLLPGRGKVPASCEKVPPTRGKVLPTRGKVPPTRGKVPRTRGKVPRTRGKVALSSAVLVSRRTRSPPRCRDGDHERGATRRTCPRQILPVLGSRA